MGGSTASKEDEKVLSLEVMTALGRLDGESALDDAGNRNGSCPATTVEVEVMAETG